MRPLVEDPDGHDVDVEPDPTAERGPPGPTPDRARADTTVFVDLPAVGLTLVTKGAPLPDGRQVPAVWDHDGRCWNPE